MAKLIGRILRIIAWLAPVYQFRASVVRKCGVKVGKNVYIGNMVYFDGEYPHLITLEDHVSIAPGVQILAHSGGSPFHQKTKIFKQPPKPIIIKQGAWIGSGAIILPGVTIGVGSIVAAGAVVSKDIPDFSVAAGNPARVVSKLEKPSKKETKGEA
ncbi:MAG: acyltransferase [Asgard group archaeon]|nr:acyltransferase [Asgard group archaeon]